MKNPEEFVTVSTEDVTGPALDWIVAKCEIRNDVRDSRPRFWMHSNNKDLICFQTYNHTENPKGYDLYSPSTDLKQGDEIIERHHISVFPDAAEPWKGIITPNENEPHFYFRLYGPTRLIAAMRCFVTSKMGPEIQIPSVLWNESMPVIHPISNNPTPKRNKP